MTRRDRILTASRKERADRFPSFTTGGIARPGGRNRECRNRGMGINMLRQPYVEKVHGVEMTEMRMTVEGRPVIRRTFSTPVGSVYEDEFREAGTGQWKLTRSWKGNQAWITARMIKGPEDYKVVKYMVEHTEYIADYFSDRASA